jgi:hypothetical protein
MYRDFKGVWIPKHIWDNKEMIWTEKLLFIEIDSLAKNGECFASNEHFAEFLSVSTRQIQNLLSTLQQKGFIKIQLFYKGNTKIVCKRIISPLHTFSDEVDFTRTDEPEFAHMDEPDFTRTDEVEFVDSNTINISNTINNTSNKKINKKSAQKSELESEFETLWAIYPKRVNVAVARTSYIKARKERKYTYETIKIGLERYIEYLQVSGKGRNSEYILNGSTFFNQDRFLDEYNVQGLKFKPTSLNEYLRQKHGGEENEQARSRKIIDVYPENLPEPFQGF